MCPEGNGFLSEVDRGSAPTCSSPALRAERFLIYTRALDTLRVVFLPAGPRLRFFAPSHSNWSRLCRCSRQRDLWRRPGPARCILLVRGLASSRTVPGLECVASAVLPERAAAKNLIHFKNASSLTLSKQPRRNCTSGLAYRGPRFYLNQVRSWRERTERKKPNDISCSTYVNSNELQKPPAAVKACVENKGCSKASGNVVFL